MPLNRTFVFIDKGCLDQARKAYKVRLRKLLTVVGVFHNITLHAPLFYHRRIQPISSGKPRPHVHSTRSPRVQEMSTTQGSMSYANRIEISDSLKAGLRGHRASLRAQEPSLITAQMVAQQRRYVSRSIPSANVYESHKDTEETSKDGKDCPSKRKSEGELILHLTTTNHYRREANSSPGFDQFSEQEKADK